MIKMKPFRQTELRIHPATRLGHVHLNVANLDRLKAFYQNVLGLKLIRHEGFTTSLGTDQAELLRLSEQADARRVEHTTGLYHFCILVPERLDLAHLLKRIVDTHSPVQGIVDHHVSEAIYLPDPEGNGIEIDWDHARDRWPAFETMMRIGNLPLDVDNLMDELKKAPGSWNGLPPDTRIGHVHLHVNDLTASETFYHGLLGFDKTWTYPGQAGFVSAGGYHHHIAYNLWAGRNTPPPPPDATGLRYFTVQFPNKAKLAGVLARIKKAQLDIEETREGFMVRDPSRNRILLTDQS